jgi:hypothetical protein
MKLCACSSVFVQRSWILACVSPAMSGPLLSVSLLVKVSLLTITRTAQALVSFLSPGSSIPFSISTCAPTIVWNGRDRDFTPPHYPNSPPPITDSLHPPSRARPSHRTFPSPLLPPHHSQPFRPQDTTRSTYTTPLSASSSSSILCLALVACMPLAGLALVDIPGCERLRGRVGRWSWRC